MVFVSPHNYYRLPSFPGLAGNALADLINEDLPTLPGVLWNALSVREEGAGCKVRISKGEHLT